MRGSELVADRPAPSTPPRLQDFHVLITGGAGFVGANLAIALTQRRPEWKITALDNLYRRGSELNLPRLEAAGVRFVRGDVRELEDLENLQPINALVECSAEPSAMAGVDGNTSYAFQSNLVGAYNCLELARRDHAQIVFLSTSRVYPFAPLASLELDETPTRFEIAANQKIAGASPAGITENFPLAGARTLYGTTKLAAELLITEYAEMFELPTVINRCGVIAGPWQMGKVDQGVFTYWMLAHHFDLPLSYIGFDRSGRQVRDLLYIDDLIELVCDQLERPEHWNGASINVGGGRDVSLSLLETTELCREITGTEITVGQADHDRAGDIAVYISDCGGLFDLTDWRPQTSARGVLEEISSWIEANRDQVRRTLIDK